MSKGRVYLVGAGPGDPGLITVRGRELLARADVVVYDYLASPRLLDLAAEKAERIYVGKQASGHTLDQARINQLLVDRARAGATVVRLKGGDPFVFGRGGEEALALAEAGIAFEVVPGVTAGVAAAAYAGIPVTHRGLASNLGLVTGHETPDKEDSDLDFDALARWGGTLVFYMGVRNLASICARLMEHGLSGETPAAVVRWGTTVRQEVVTATLRTLAQKVQEADIKPPAVAIIGQVVSLRDKLRWFERRPMFGRRVVVTRARAQASDLTALLEAQGAEVIEMPTIRIEPPQDSGPLGQAVGELDRFDWIIFTSVNGVEGFFAALARAGRDSRALAPNRICAIGPATAGRLARFGIRVDAHPTKFLSAEIVRTLASLQDLSGARVLCPHADIAPPDLAADLERQGATVREVVAYRTVADESGAEHVLELLEQDKLDWITFTSSSTVRSFFAVIPPEKVRAHLLTRNAGTASGSVRLASIGPATSAAIRRLGPEVHVEAETHTIEGLVEAIMAWKP